MQPRVCRPHEAYATGSYRGQRTFVRFSDLKEFAEDIQGLMPDVHKTSHHFTGRLSCRKSAVYAAKRLNIRCICSETLHSKSIFKAFRLRKL